MSSSIFRHRLSKEFNGRTARFHTSVNEDRRIFEDDIDGTEAHDIMLHEQGIIPLDALKRILTALEETREEWRKGEVEVGAEFEDIHEYIEKRVIDKVGIEVGGMIHTGRSRNDQVAVDIRLRTRMEILDIAGATLDLIETLIGQAELHVETLMMLYTHSQHAQVGTFAHYMAAYADALARDFQRLMECYSRVNMNPLGAGPVGGTSIAIDRERTTSLLGFDDLVENSIDATSGRDFAIEPVASCAILMSNLSRVAADLLEWSSVEFGYVEVADEYASSSSIMPQKKNPSTLELIRGKTAEAYGALTELLTMVKGVPSGYYQDLQGTKPPLWRCFDVVKTSVEVMTGIVSTLKVNADTMAKALEGSMTAAVELAERLVGDAGLSFRESYRLVAALVRCLLDEGGRLQDLTPAEVEEVAQKVLGKHVSVEERLIAESADPKISLARRISRGSPRPEGMKRMLRERRKALTVHRSTLQVRRSAIDAARTELIKTVKGYMEK